MDKQLALPLDAPVEDVRIYRARSWPEGAPSLSHVRAQAAALLAELRGRAARRKLASPRLITVTANRRVSISFRMEGRRVYRLRLHWRLLAEPTVIVEGIENALSSGRFPPSVSSRLTEIARDADGGGHYPRRSPPGSHRGEHIDLHALLERARAHLPDAAAVADIEIVWGRRSPRRRKRRHLRLGSYDVSEQRIVMHPVLDDSRIPDYVIEHVVFHELCHAVAPPLTAQEAKRRSEHRIHHRAFRALEARFPRLTEAEAWIERHIDRLLRAASRS